MTGPSKVIFFFNFLWAHYAGAVFTVLSRVAPTQNLEINVVHLAETSSERLILGPADPSFHGYEFDLLFEGALDSVGDWALSRALVSRMLKSKAEVVVLPGYDRVSYWALLLVAVLFRKRRVIRLESTEADWPRVWWKEFPKRLFVGLCNAGLAYGSSSKAYLVKLGMSADVIAVDCQSISQQVFSEWACVNELDTASAKENANIRFLFVGRLSPEKGVKTLLSAFKDVQSKFPHAELVLAGDGPSRRELEESVQVLGISSAVSFLGAVPIREMPDLYCRHHVLVLPSHSEPWGLVVNEALFFGRPAIVSDKCGCIPELIAEDETGWSFRSGDVANLSEKMCNAVNFSKLIAMSPACRQLSRYYSPERAASQMIKGIEFAMRTPVPS